MCSLMLAFKLANQTNRSQFIIYIKSPGIIHTISKRNLKTEMAINIQELYYNITKSGKSITIETIQTEETIDDNSICPDNDRAVGDSNSVLTISNTIDDLRTYINKISFEKWDKIWRDQKASILHKKIEHVNNLKLNSKLSRREQVIISRIRTGHCKLRHLHLLTNNTPPICPICSIPNTIQHLIVECPQFSQERQKYLQGTNFDSILDSPTYQKKL